MIHNVYLVQQGLQGEKIICIAMCLLRSYKPCMYKYSFMYIVDTDT